MRCGILPVSDDWNVDWLPLIALSANATILENSSRLILKQSFSNPNSKAIDEAVYHFPIYEGAAIVAFTCKIDERIIQGVVRDKHDASKLYEAAKKQGQKAALIANPQPDLWTTKISNIPANGRVEVEITVVCELKHDSQVDGIRFVLPTNIADRYGTPPENLPPGISSESRGIQMAVAVTMASPITSLQSPSHPIEVGMGTHTPNKSLSKEEFDVCKGYATLSQKDTALDKDFVLIVISAGIGQPQAIVESHPARAGSRALLFSLVPKFQMPRIKPEIVFIADRSGSMEENIPQLKNALKVFLKSLPVGVKFNICSFGSEHTFLWPKSMPYDQDNLDTAMKHVETFAADYGGTEMFPPVKEALKNRYKDLETEIIVLTDGEIWETKSLFDLVQAECESNQVRVFTLGIGESVSHILVEGLARAGRGYAQLVGNGDKLDAKVVRMLKATLGAHAKDYQLVFPEGTLLTEAIHEQDFELVERAEGFDSEKIDSEQGQDAQTKATIPLYNPAADKSPGVKLTDSAVSSEDRFSHLPAFNPPSRLQTPYHIPPLYPFSRTNVYIFLSGSEVTPRSISLKGTTTSGVNLALEVPITDVGNGTTVHQLAAKKLLQDLDEGRSYLHSGKFGVEPKDEGKFMDWIEREGVRVGTTFGLAGKWTSFVAVENMEELEYQKNAMSGEDEECIAEAQCLFSGDLLPAGAAPADGGHMFAGGVGSVQRFSSRVPMKLAMVAHEPDDDGCGPSYEAGDVGETDMDDNIQCRYKSVEIMAEPEMDVLFCDPIVRDSASDSASDPAGQASEHPVEDVPSNGVSKTYELLEMQAFDGSFPSGSGQWAPKLTEACKKWIQQEHEEELAKLRALSEEELEKLLASAVSIAIFQTELTEFEDIWDMVVEKTDNWGVEKVGETAWSALKLWVNEQVHMADDVEKQSFWVTQKE